MDEYDQRIIGNEYRNPAIDERFIVTGLQDWGMGYGIMMMRYEDNVEWDEGVGFLDECELVREGTLPIPMDFFTEEGAKSRARSFGYGFAWTLCHEDDGPEDGIHSEQDVAHSFRDHIRTGEVTDDTYQMTLGEVFERFEDAAIDRDEVLESIWEGFRESVSEDRLYELPSPEEQDSIQEFALAP